MEYVELKDSDEQQYKQELRYLDDSNQPSIYSEIEEEDNFNETKFKNKSDTFKVNTSPKNNKNRTKRNRAEEPIDIEPLDNLSMNKPQDSIPSDKDLLDIEDPW